MRLRRLIHGMGFRYRLHVKNLPGTPDLVFPSRKAVIFMHGCFWHRHQDCRLARMPKSRVVFWREKLESNKRRDEENMRQLNELGYQSVEERLIFRRGYKEGDCAPACQLCHLEMTIMTQSGVSATFGSQMTNMSRFRLPIRAISSAAGASAQPRRPDRKSVV